MSVLLTQSSWAAVEGWDGSADDATIAGFAPDNVGPQNATALAMDPAAGVDAAGYKLTGSLGLIEANKSISTWVKFGANSLTAFLGFHIIPDGTDPIANQPVGVFAQVTRTSNILLTASIGMYDTPLASAIASNSGTIDVADATIPFKLSFQLEAYGADHYMQLTISDVTGGIGFLRAAKTSSPFVGASAGSTIFKAAAAGGNIPGDLVSWDDITIDNDKITGDDDTDAYVDQFEGWT